MVHPMERAVSDGLIIWLMVASAMAVLAWRWRHPAVPPRDREVDPAALRGAVLWCAEKTFKTTRPISISARVDRVYRLPTGMLVLVEFKTRGMRAPTASDVIQLSAQRVALSGATGWPVSDVGFVLIEAPGSHRPRTAHRLQLLSTDAVVDLVLRRRQLLAGEVAAQWAGDGRACRNCAFRAGCGGADRAAIRAGHETRGSARAVNLVDSAPR
jgi:hypothetical protein